MLLMQENGDRSFHCKISQHYSYMHKMSQKEPHI